MLRWLPLAGYCCSLPACCAVKQLFEVRQVKAGKGRVTNAMWYVKLHPTLFVAELIAGRDRRCDLRRWSKACTSTATVGQMP
jgi:hypothetical protein